MQVIYPNEGEFILDAIWWFNAVTSVWMGRATNEKGSHKRESNSINILAVTPGLPGKIAREFKI